MHINVAGRDLCFSIRLLKNYEYDEKASVTLSSILELAMGAGFNVESSTLGQSISKIWKTKVIRAQDLDQPISYKNLAFRCYDTEPITELNERTLEEITAICLKHQDWFVSSSGMDTQQVVIMKNQVSEMQVDGKAMIFRIIVSVAPQADIKISTYGHELSMKQMHLLGGTHVSSSAIHVSISWVETATPCFGQPLPANINQCFKVPVSNSKVISLTTAVSDTPESERRLVSVCCSLLSYSCPNPITGIVSCRNCSSARRLLMKREHKREKAMCMKQAPHPKSNQIHLSRKGLELKVAEQKKKIKEVKRLKREEVEYIELVEEDHADLVKIVEASDTTAMKPEMKLLWETQMKQLSVKSSNGYRWDPRYSPLFHIKFYS